MSINLNSFIDKTKGASDNVMKTQDFEDKVTKNNNNNNIEGVNRKIEEDIIMQDLYTPRSYHLTNSRPTMISAKYRQKEERRKVLKLSMNKLKAIDDPENSLRRSVLINNTLRRLQKEAKEEKAQKSQQSRCFGITNDFLAKQEENLKSDPLCASLTSRTSDQLLDITNIQDGLKSFSKFSNDNNNQDNNIMPDLMLTDDRQSRCQSNTGRKRSIDETLDEDCDVLSQFYLASTPRVTGGNMDDEDEDVNVVDVDTPPSCLESPCKRRRQGSIEYCADGPTAADRLRDHLTLSPHEWTTLDDSVQSSGNSSPFSCGHSTMLNEIVVYHNLIASLES